MFKKTFACLFLCCGFLALGIPAAQSILAPPMVYSDVVPDQWYSKGIDYVSEKQWMTGYESGYTGENRLFGINDTVTRAQLATILMRYDLAYRYKMDELREIICLNKNNFLNFANVDTADQKKYGESIKSFCQYTRGEYPYGVNEFTGETTQQGIP